MPRLSKKLKDEMQFFINPKTHKRQYNLHCQYCMRGCKQSYRVQIICCPKFCKSADTMARISPIQGGTS